MSSTTTALASDDLRTTVRHGVPHVVVPAPGPVRARLLFRVGMVDETVQHRGLTHLVEHLVMRAVGRRAIEVNGHTGPWTTGFEAVGGAADVTAFVEDVWAALADLPTDAVDLERRVLRHEASTRGTTPALDAVHHRFGVTGPGRLWTDELGLEAATASTVRAWVRDRFVRGAAALASTADIRPDLSPELGPGEASELPVPVAARGGRGPVWVGDAGGTAVSLLLPSAAGTDLAVGRLLLDAAEDAVRHERALAYDVGMDCITVTPDTSEVAVYAACEPEQQAEVAGLLVDAVRRLRDDGPDPDLLDLDRRRSTIVWTEMPDALETAAEGAVMRLLGRPPRTVAERLEDAVRLDASRVQEVVRAAWSSLQVLLPLQEDPGIADVPECRHDDPPVGGRALRGNPLAGLVPGARLPLSLRDSLTVGDQGLTLRLGEETSTVRWEQVAAVVRQPEAVTVLGHDGTTILVPRGTFLGGGRALSAIDTVVPASLVIDAPA